MFAKGQENLRRLEMERQNRMMREQMSARHGRNRALMGAAGLQPNKGSLYEAQLREEQELSVYLNKRTNLSNRVGDYRTSNAFATSLGTSPFMGMATDALADTIGGAPSGTLAE